MTLARWVLRLAALCGGLQLGCAALLLWGAARPERVRLALVAQSLLYGGLAGARAVAWWHSGAPGALGLALRVLAARSPVA